MTSNLLKTVTSNDPDLQGFLDLSELTPKIFDGSGCVNGCFEATDEDLPWKTHDFV